MYSLGKWGSWVVTFQEMAQEEDFCSRRQAEKLSWVNVLQHCAEVQLARDFASPHAFHYCSDVSPAWPALFLLCEQVSCQDFLKSALRQQIIFFFSYMGSFSPSKSLLCHKCSFPLAPRFKKRHRKMKSGDNTQCSITRTPAWRHFCFSKKMSNKFSSIKVTRSQFKEKERQFQHESLLYKFCKLQK